MTPTAFLEDIYPRDLLYGVTIRSPIAKGFIKFISLPKLPDNYLLITAKEIPGENRLEDTAMPILADRELNYIGEPVAVLLGSDKTKLEELAANCEVFVSEEKPIFSCEDTSLNDESITENANGAFREIINGNPQEVFQNGGKIVTGSYITGIQDHWYAEPVGAVTLYSDPSSLLIKTATQWPYHVKRSVMRCLGAESSSINVEQSALSIHMDGKFWYPSLIACHAALGTYITKKPVRLILNREEDFLFSPKRFKANIGIASSIDENGNIKAAEIDISVNLGAYGVNRKEILDQICLGCISLYKIDNFRLKARAEITNLPPQGPFSGFGLAQGLFAIERHVTQIADTVNNDPALWRINRINTSKNQSSGVDLINTTVKMSDYFRKWASYELLRKSRKENPSDKKENPRGIGIALGFQGNDLLYIGEDKGSYTVEVTLTKESILEIKTSISSSEDYQKIWEKAAMETMSIGPDMVRITANQSPDCGPSCTSRNITVITKLVEKCFLAIRKQRFHNPLPITVRRSAKPQYGDLFGRFNASASEKAGGKIMNTGGFARPGLICSVVEVTIDIKECIPKVKGIWLGVDGGKIISANRAKRSLTRGAVQALGWAFTENVEYISGAIPKSQYENFTIPRPSDIPPVYIDFVCTDSSEPKGVGDLPFTCIPAAFLQAVSQAMDYSFRSIPLKRNEIWEMVRSK